MQFVNSKQFSELISMCKSTISGEVISFLRLAEQLSLHKTTKNASDETFVAVVVVTFH